MTAPTARQLSILAFMRSYQEEHHVPPSLREIANHFGIKSTNAVHDHLAALVKRGLVRAPHTRGRSYLPVEEPKAAPWNVCRVAFHLDDPGRFATEFANPTRAARVSGDADPTSPGLPPGWSYDGLGDGRQPFATFSVDGVPTAEAGEQVATWLRQIGAVR